MAQDRSGFYFPHRDNHQQRPSDGLRRYVRYFGPFEDLQEAKWYSAWHHNVAGQFARYEEYQENEIQYLVSLPEEALGAAKAKFMHQEYADYQGLTFRDIRSKWEEWGRDSDF